ncbi:MAG: translation elongation factor Ts [Patescibacteria group bacterium]
MNIDLQTISQLRDKTGAGIGDCKKALEESGGDIDLAIENLRKRGEIKAAKKSDRATKEGVIALASEGDKLAVVALACETDFVSRTDEFGQTVSDFATHLLANNSLDEFKSWAEKIMKDELVMKIGENLQLGGYGVFTGSPMGTYLHSNKKVAGVVVLSGGSKDLADDIALHLAAMSPKYLNPQEVPTDVLDKEKEIYREQLKSENKPEAIWDKIIDGKLNKFYEDNCLLNQVFVKDDTKKIKDLLGDATITAWARYQL